MFGVGEKAPAGAHLVAPSLESTCFMSLRHKNQDSLFSKHIISYLEKTFKFAYYLKSYFWLGFRTENAKTNFPYHQPKILIWNCLYYHGVIYNSRWVPLSKLLRKVTLGKSSEMLPIPKIDISIRRAPREAKNLGFFTLTIRLSWNFVKMTLWLLIGIIFASRGLGIA